MVSCSDPGFEEDLQEEDDCCGDAAVGDLDVASGIESGEWDSVVASGHLEFMVFGSLTD